LILTRKRFATFVATMSVVAAGIPASAASADDAGLRVSTIVGPTITGGNVVQTAGAGGQSAAAAPQAIALLSTTAGGTMAFGTGGYWPWW
jgi:hypothetical protein